MELQNKSDKDQTHNSQDEETYEGYPYISKKYFRNVMLYNSIHSQTAFLNCITMNI